MGLFNLGVSSVPLFASDLNRPYENLGMVEGMYEYDNNAMNQSEAVSKAKNELRRMLGAIRADAAINVKYCCFPSNNVCTIIVYGDAVKYQK